jgi:hypothetical protein
MKRASFQLGTVTVNCFESEQGEYLYSLTDMGNVINKTPDSPLKWMQSKTFKALPGGNFTPLKLKEGNVNYSLVPTWVAMAYITHNALTNQDKVAGEVLMALAMESLDIRAINALKPDTQVEEVSHNAKS